MFPRIADFGLAIEESSRGEDRRRRCGTPNYLAPEVVKEKLYSFPSDIYTFGCVVYEMLTGMMVIPARGDNNKDEVYKQILNATIHYPKSLSKNFTLLLDGMLEANAEERLTVRSILNHPALASRPTHLPLDIGEKKPEFGLPKGYCKLDSNVVCSVQAAYDYVEDQTRHWPDGKDARVNSVLRKAHPIFINLFPIDLRLQTDDKMLVIRLNDGTKISIYQNRSMIMESGR